MSRLMLTGTLVLLAVATVISLFASGNRAQSFPSNKTEAPTDRLSDEFRLGEVAHTVTKLRRVHTTSTDTMIPSTAKSLLKTLKHQLIELIANRLYSENADASVQQLQAILIENLRRVGVIVTEPICEVINQQNVDLGYDYGAVYDITIKRPQSCSDLLTVTTTLGVPCGSDTSLYIFKYENNDWRLKVSCEVNDYADISGVQGRFAYGISWPREDGQFFIVTASVNPWCSSNWQAITYRALRPGGTPEKPQVLLSKTQTIWLGDEPAYRLDVHNQSFTLSFHDEKYLELLNNGQDLSIDDPNGMRIIKYEVDEDSVKQKD
ncbi:MAG TPA: hypothetical protein VKN18_08545 [Blastocatellia bacterium]|nr:hypothetical protein [Blastocatellia bacterium]